MIILSNRISREPEGKANMVKFLTPSCCEFRLATKSFPLVNVLSLAPTLQGILSFILVQAVLHAISHTTLQTHKVHHL